jgi:hypothetical protein
VLDPWFYLQEDEQTHDVNITNKNSSSSSRKGAPGSRDGANGSSGGSGCIVLARYTAMPAHKHTKVSVEHAGKEKQQQQPVSAFCTSKSNQKKVVTTTILTATPFPSLALRLVAAAAGVHFYIDTAVPIGGHTGVSGNGVEAARYSLIISSLYPRSVLEGGQRITHTALAPSNIHYRSSPTLRRRGEGQGGVRHDLGFVRVHRPLACSALINVCVADIYPPIPAPLALALSQHLPIGGFRTDASARFGGQ